ncbi:MAG: hypothetical protein KIT88_10170 [Phycisphaeraceae bacterium]|nr:hypothetical protein [Phycisphaeraceae bacterium]
MRPRIAFIFLVLSALCFGFGPTPVKQDAVSTKVWNAGTSSTAESANMSVVAEMFYGEAPVRFVFCSDSFGISYLPARLPTALAIVDEQIEINAITMGSINSAHAALRTTCPVPNRLVDGSEQYRVHSDENQYFSLPIKAIHEIRDDFGALGWTNIANLYISNGTMGRSGNPWLSVDDLIAVRPLMIGSYDGHQLQQIRFGDYEADATAFGFDSMENGLNVALNPLEIGSLAADIYLGSGRNLSIDANLTDSDRSALLAGYTVYKTDENGSPLTTGKHWSVLADNSWSRSGFVNNMEPNDANAPSNRKVFARRAMREWLYSTTFRSETIMFVVHIAEEADDYDGHYQFMQDFVAEAEAWTEGIAPSFHVFFIINNVHHTGRLNGHEEMENLRIRGQAALDYCSVEPRASFFSIFERMDQVYPTTDEKSGIAGEHARFMQWLADNHYNNWYYGDNIGPVNITDALDNPNGLHPMNADAAAMFADQLKRGLRDAYANCGVP